MFSKILIANRGEIAVRIIRACKEMGIATVAVYSQADSQALHVDLADESVCIGPAPAGESYLNENRIIAAAMATGAQAIHPGYGFLSENAHFARLCRQNSLVFIGPDAGLMDRLSDKTSMKREMQAAGITVIPGTQTLGSEALLVNVTGHLGFAALLGHPRSALENGADLFEAGLAVAQLTARLARHHRNARGTVGHPHGRVGGVDALAAGAGSPKDLHLTGVVELVVGLTRVPRVLGRRELAVACRHCSPLLSASARTHASAKSDMVAAEAVVHVKPAASAAARVGSPRHTALRRA